MSHMPISFLVFASAIALTSGTKSQTFRLNFDSVGATLGMKIPGDTFIENGVSSWKHSTSGQDGALHDFPSHYLNSDLSYQIKIPEYHMVPANSYAEYRCPESFGPCDVVVFAYECNGCSPPVKTGGLPGQLLADDYTRTRCAPTFTTGSLSSTHKYQMVAFVKTIDAGATETIELSKDTHLVAFALSRGNAPPCSSFKKDNCDEGSHYRCQWTKGQCSLALCRPQGPAFKGCTDCALDEY